MKLAVIGEPCMDYIYRGSSATKKQFGGILYSVVSLAVISEGKAEIYPVMNLGEDEYENVTGFLKKFGNINTGFIKRTSHKTRVVNLYYKDKNQVLNVPAKRTYDREENSTEPTLPVSYTQVNGLLPDLDGILVNMVSGVDITLGSLQKVRAEFSGYIHMDLHNLVMQTFPDGTRKQLPVKDWQSWVNCTDSLQMNESEINILTGDNVTEYDTAYNILKNGKVRSLVITRCMEGISLYETKVTAGKPQLCKTNIASIDTPAFIDSTGCGDVFASAFFYKNTLLRQMDFHSAAEFASGVAGKNASLHGVEDLHKLNEVIK